MLGGPRGSPFRLRVPRVPRARWKTHRGWSGAFDDAAGAWVRQRDVARYAYRARGLSTRLGSDRVCSSHFERLTCCQCFLGALWWAYKRVGCRILPPVGYLRYFDT
jgi:hypothetical protein